MSSKTIPKPIPSTLDTPQRNSVDAGTFVGIHGLRGELKFAATRAGGDALAPGVTFQATLRSGNVCDIVVAATRVHQHRPLVRLEGVNDATAAERYIGARLQVARDAVPVGEGEYFDDDLTGCTLVDPLGTPLGDVVGVAHYPASDMLIVGPKRALVPLVRAFVRSVDITAKRIVVELPDGLLDDAAAEIDRPG